MLFAFCTTCCSITLFAVVYIAFCSAGFITYTLTCRKRLLSLVSSKGRLATLAQEGLFGVFKGVRVIIAVEETLLSF